MCCMLEKLQHIQVRNRVPPSCSMTYTCCNCQCMLQSYRVCTRIESTLINLMYTAHLLIALLEYFVINLFHYYFSGSAAIMISVTNLQLNLKTKVIAGHGQ